MINFASANKKIVKLESRTLAIPVEKYRGVEQSVARQAHNLEVAGSSPASATCNGCFRVRSRESCLSWNG